MKDKKRRLHSTEFFFNYFVIIVIEYFCCLSVCKNTQARTDEKIIFVFLKVKMMKNKPQANVCDDDVGNSVVQESLSPSTSWLLEKRSQKDFAWDWNKLEQKEIRNIGCDKAPSITIITFREQAMPHHCCWWNPNEAHISIRMSSPAPTVTNKRTPLFYHCHPSQVGLIIQFKLWLNNTMHAWKYVTVIEWDGSKEQVIYHLLPLA